ncbi:MAG TPA: hypothetical protein VHL34_07455 [Rhizomicrobium sp.]|jgi:hypothetical protein|nr:hypothetical protein [Rhizomicrobium sp.]
MSLLLGLAPFIIFFVLMRVSISLALWGAFAAAFVLCIRDFLRTGVLRALDTGSIVIFGVLAIYTGFFQRLSIPAVRLAVDGSLTFIIFASMLMRAPFTMQYAREQVPSDFWATPIFVRSNYMLTAVWGIAFAVTTGADTAATFAAARVSLTLCVAIGLGAMAAAMLFTIRYVAMVRRQAGLPDLPLFR